MSQAEAFTKANKTAIAKTCHQYIENYDNIHAVAEAFMATGENRRADFYTHNGLADTD